MMNADQAIDQIAKALYNSHAHSFPWEQAKPEHQDLFRKEARAAIHEILAIATLKTAFPDMEQVQ